MYVDICEAEGSNDALHALDHPVALATDPLPTLHGRAQWTIKYENREERHAHEFGAAKE